MTSRPATDPRRPPSGRIVALVLALFMFGLLLQAGVVFADVGPTPTTMAPSARPPDR
ncbi:MAG: hypothetical protein ACRDPR_18655 [Nocardioidaceae bacterium]